VIAVVLKGPATFRERAPSFRSGPNRSLAGVMAFVPPAAESSGRSNSCKQGRACPWRRSPRAGLWGLGQFTRHFKRIAGVTPGQFRAPARTV
jgi:hypothetical protein